MLMAGMEVQITGRPSLEKVKPHRERKFKELNVTVLPTEFVWQVISGVQNHHSDGNQASQKKKPTSYHL